MANQKPKVLLIGWDAAEWKVINPLMDAGKMPVLESLVNGGVMGKLGTLTPVLSPMLWTSIATGKRPYKHGILGFAEPDPDKGGVRPITNLSRRTKAVWNILSQSGLKSNIHGWWPSHPAEPVNGVMVSNHFQQARSCPPQDWPVLAGTIHPPGLEALVAQFRVHPTEIEAGQILPFVPGAAGIDHAMDKRCGRIASFLAECAGVHACATAVMQNEAWDFMAVYYDAIDHISHGFMRYHPPRMEHVSETDFELYKGVVEGIYQFHDMMLGSMLKLAGEDLTVIVMSDHGFHPDHLRHKEIPQEPNGPAVEHSHHGIFVAKGPGIRKDASVFGASLLDITPTLLTLFGLPVGEDMDGRPLTEIWEHPPRIKTIPSWDAVPGDDGCHPPHFRFDPADDQALLRQLVDLGYVEDPGADRQEAERRCYRELRFNLARAYVDGNRHADSIPILEELTEQAPGELRFLNQLAFSYLSVERVADARRIAQQILGIQYSLSREVAVKIPEFRMKTGNRDVSSLPADQQEEYRSLQAGLVAGSSSQHLLWAHILIAEGKNESALEVLEMIPESSWTSPVLPLRIGHIHLCLKHYEQAEKHLLRAIELDPQNAPAYQTLMQVRLEQKRFQNAAECGFTAVGLLYFYPLAHYQLGCALAGMGHHLRAMEALEVAVSQNPNLLEAHELLAKLHASYSGRTAKSREHRQIANRLAALRAQAGATPPPAAGLRVGIAPVSISERPDIPPSWTEDQIMTIVSGLPRSGTSMMMQMLQAGGMPCLVDGAREPDENNPRGYYEFDAVKRLHSDSSLLGQATGKAVKIVAPLLPRLPAKLETPFRIVFMERDLDEVLASQAAMLARLGKEPGSASPDAMKTSYAKLLSQVNAELGTRQIPTLVISHRETIANPHEVAERLNRFCGGTLHEPAMVAAVDSALHRTKITRE